VVHSDPLRIATLGCVASCVALRPAVRSDLRCIAVVVASRSALRSDKKICNPRIAPAMHRGNSSLRDGEGEGPLSDGSSGL